MKLKMTVEIAYDSYALLKKTNLKKDLEIKWKW